MSDQTWIVVCTQYHQAVGPYPDEDSALKEAEHMTEQDECVYVPVPMIFRGKLMLMEESRKESEDDGRHIPGQYL